MLLYNKICFGFGFFSYTYYHLPYSKVFRGCVWGVVPVESHLFSLCELLVHRTEVLLRLQEMGAARVKVSTKTSVIFFLGYVEHRGTLN